MTYVVERIGAGDVTAFDLLNTSSYLLSNWTLQTDQGTIEWVATMPEFGLQRQFARGIELGSGRFTGAYSGIVEFFLLTEDMQQYINTNILSSKPVNTVTIYAYDDYSRARVVVTGELAISTEYQPFGNVVHSNVQYQFTGGTSKTASYILLESGDYLLLETGDKIGLETQD